MDSRYNELRRLSEAEGLSTDEKELAAFYLEAPAQHAVNLSTLLRGALSERGNLFDPLKAAAKLGVAAGRVLLGGILCDHSQCLAQPYAPLTADEWQRGKQAMNAEDMTCDKLLATLLKTRKVIARRQLLSAAA